MRLGGIIWANEPEAAIKAAEKSTKARRSLGIGYIGLAHYLAKNKVKYEVKHVFGDIVFSIHNVIGQLIFFKYNNNNYR